MAHSRFYCEWSLRVRPELCNQGDKPGLIQSRFGKQIKDYREIILSQDVLEKVGDRFETVILRVQ